MNANAKFVDYDPAAAVFDTVCAARYLRKHPVTLKIWRTANPPVGPSFVKTPTGAVLYRRADLDAYLARHVVSTVDDGLAVV